MTISVFNDALTFQSARNPNSPFALMENKDTRAQVSTPADAQIQHGSSAAARQTIMVVEDSDDIRMMMRYLLEMEGYCVLEATDGLQAVELALSERPCLIMMDLSLPLLDGLAATYRIREHLNDIPIVALSGHTTADYRSAAFAAGCTDYLVKPLDFKLLDTILARLSC